MPDELLNSITQIPETFEPFDKVTVKSANFAFRVSGLSDEALAGFFGLLADNVVPSTTINNSRNVSFFMWVWVFGFGYIVLYNLSIKTHYKKPLRHRQL